MRASKLFSLITLFAVAAIAAFLAFTAVEASPVGLVSTQHTSTPKSTPVTLTFIDGPTSPADPQ